ncbi:MAG: NUDIX hydrolase [Bacteroidales bacterium]|nr:NUDIX hydrolase [Bacteroidales bacterium]
MKNQTYKAPHHHVAADCIIFGYEENELKILLFHRSIPPSKGEWSLIGGWVNPDETTEKAAERVLHHITGLKDIYMEQVHVFSDPDRDPGGRVISIAYYALISIAEHNKDLVREYGAHWWPISKMPKLIFDHESMVERALEKLRLKASYELTGIHLLPDRFTITQLRDLYTAIFQRDFDPGNFRRKILSLDLIERLRQKDTSDSKKGAFYYKIKENITLHAGERIVNYIQMN